MTIRLSQKITARTTELLAQIKRQPVNLLDVYSHAGSHVRSLAYDAYLAHLDGRAARSRALHKEADRLRRKLPAEYR